VKEIMKHRISAGVILVEDETILMVNHKKPGYYDFWVPPGGGVLGIEDIESAAKRELKEETGLTTSSIKLAYIEEFYKPEERGCKFWFYSNNSNGYLQVEPASAEREQIIDVQFIKRSNLSKLTVFPPIVLDQLWDDIKIGFTSPRFLGIRKMEFY
jgi:8-oxo-dGTP pyrophosphatase MutT (NUDIX family)